MEELRQPVWLSLDEIPPLPDGWRSMPTAEACIQLKPGKLFDSRTVSASGSVPVLNQSATNFLGYQINNLYDFFMVFVVMSTIAAVLLYMLSFWMEKRMGNVK